jgi:invasion protein IalB
MRWFLFFSISALISLTAVAGAVLLGWISFGNSDTPQIGAAAATSEAVSSGQQLAPGATGSGNTQGQPPAAQPPEQPQVVAQETMEDWIYVCQELPSTGARGCSIHQRLSDAKTQANVFLWRISQDGKGGLVSTWAAPDGVLLYRGVGIDAGTPKPIVVPFETCVNGQCRAVAILNEELIKIFTEAENITVTIVGLNNKQFSLPISTKGLARGIEALQAANQTAN